MLAGADPSIVVEYNVLLAHPMVSLEFFIDTILPAALWPWG